jgi:hypothetical protein
VGGKGTLELGRKCDLDKVFDDTVHFTQIPVASSEREKQSHVSLVITKIVRIHFPCRIIPVAKEKEIN